MIRAIAAVDDRLGISSDTGIPWNVPADVEHFRALTMSSNVLMGYGTYTEFANPMQGCTNYVATRRTEKLRDGFLPVSDLRSFFADGFEGDLWIIGGAMLYATTLEEVEELALTRVAGDFGCTKFFPPFKDMFRLSAEEVPPLVEGVPAIRFQTWQRN
jgi:dihydrofolate reductase